MARPVGYAAFIEPGGAQLNGAVWRDEEELVEIAGVIINDPRFAATGYRKTDVRVSEQRALAARERVHFVGVRHQDVPSLMHGWLEAWQSHHLVELPTLPNPDEPWHWHL